MNLLGDPHKQQCDKETRTPQLSLFGGGKREHRYRPIFKNIRDEIRDKNPKAKERITNMGKTTADTFPTLRSKRTACEWTEDSQ